MVILWSMRVNIKKKRMVSEDETRRRDEIKWTAHPGKIFPSDP
jgi:hypothetical protein